MQAQSSIIGEVNKAQENLDYNLMIDRYGTISRLKSTLTNAWSATTLLGTLDMEYSFKTNRYNPNKESLRGLCVQLGVSTSTYTPPSTSSTTNRTTNTSSTNNTDDSEFSFAKQAWWILGIAVALIAGALAENESGGADFADSLIPGFIIGAIIGWIIKKSNE
jgi:hypothetical protein